MTTCIYLEEELDSNESGEDGEGNDDNSNNNITIIDTTQVLKNANFTCYHCLTGTVAMLFARQFE